MFSKERSRIGNFSLAMLKLEPKLSEDFHYEIAEDINLHFDQHRYPAEYLNLLNSFDKEKILIPFGSPLTFEDRSGKIRYVYFLEKTKNESKKDVSGRIGRLVFLGLTDNLLRVEYMDKDSFENEQSDVKGFLKGASKNFNFQADNKDRFKAKPKTELGTFSDYFNIYDNNDYLYIQDSLTQKILALMP